MARFYSEHDESYIEIDLTKLGIAQDASYDNDMPVRVYEDGSIHLHESTEQGAGKHIVVNGDDVVDAVRFDTMHAWIGDLDFLTANEWGVKTIDGFFSAVARGAKQDLGSCDPEIKDAEIVILDDSRNVVAKGLVGDYL